MKKLLLTTTALVALSSYTFAADLPSRTQVPTVPAPIFTWTGFYVGAQAGSQSTHDKYTDIGTLRNSGFAGGAHAGYNYQINSFVLGVEADIEGLRARHNYNASYQSGEDTYNWGYTARMTVQGSLRARFGYAIDRALIYATGGLAIARIKETYTDTDPSLAPGVEKFTSTRFGWTLGAGVAYAFTDNWSARIEYRYTDLGSHTNNVAMWAPDSGNTHKFTSNAVRVGISYKF